MSRYLGHIKPGDAVYCCEDSNTPLTAGKIYRVRKIDPKNGRFYLRGFIRTSFPRCRFVSVSLPA